MYILLKKSVPFDKAPVITAHASLACYLKYQDNPDMQEWVNGTFYKVICKVNNSKFEQAKEIENNVVLTESTLDNDEVCVVFCPREEYSYFFKKLSLWK